MSTITLTYPNVTRVRRVLAIGLIAILIFASLALIAGAILGIVSSTTREGYQADRIPVVQNSIIPLSVPTPPIADIKLVPSETPNPASVVASESALVPVAVPTPPL